MSKVYKCIAEVMAHMAKEGISKDRNNQQQGYKFRGIDDVYNALAGPMSKAGLVVLPRIVDREVVERVNKNGTALFYITVTAEFDFVCAEDGSKHTVRTYGEAMDSGDKATNKAMSAAFKYACMQAFCIPTEGDNDADATTHEVQPRKFGGMNPSELTKQAAPDGSEVREEYLGVVDKIKLGLTTGDDVMVYENAVWLNNAEKLAIKANGFLNNKDMAAVREITARIEKANAEEKK